MKVKYALTLALSHHAQLLILDEPTSGLDPVSREDLLELFLQLARQEHVTILFSTHITSDLDKCADNIIYIRNGKIIENGPMDTFLKAYQQVTTSEKPAAGVVIGARENRSGWTRPDSAWQRSAGRRHCIGRRPGSNYGSSGKGELNLCEIYSGKNGNLPCTPLPFFFWYCPSCCSFQTTRIMSPSSIPASAFSLSA
jgi:hypothetical protein